MGKEINVTISSTGATFSLNTAQIVSVSPAIVSIPFDGAATALFRIGESVTINTTTTGTVYAVSQGVLVSGTPTPAAGILQIANLSADVADNQAIVGLSSGATANVNSAAAINNGSVIKYQKEVLSSAAPRNLNVQESLSEIVTLAGGDIESINTLPNYPNVLTFVTFTTDAQTGTFVVGENVQIGTSTIAQIKSVSATSMTVLGPTGTIADNDAIIGLTSGATTAVDATTDAISYGFGQPVLGATAVTDTARGTFSGTEQVLFGGTLGANLVIDTVVGTFTVGETVTFSGAATGTAKVVSQGATAMVVTSLSNNLGATPDNAVITGGTSGATAAINGIVQVGVLYTMSGSYVSGKRVSSTTTQMVVTNLSGTIQDNEAFVGATSGAFGLVNDTDVLYTYTGGAPVATYLNMNRIRSISAVGIAGVNQINYDQSGAIQEAIYTTDSIATVNALINAASGDVSLGTANTWTALQTFSAGVAATSPTVGIGYATGAGGAVTQGTSATTGVTLNKVAGAITLYGTQNIAGLGHVKFTVTNSTVAVGDVVVVSIRSGTNGGNTVASVTTVAAGSFEICVANGNAAAGTAETGSAIIINYAVIKAASA